MSIEAIDSTAGQSRTICPGCGGSDIRLAKVRSAFFHEDRLVVVEEIPALVCASCKDQFYDDQTVVLLDLLRGDGFPAETAREEISVPVFSFRDRLIVEAER